MATPGSPWVCDKMVIVETLKKQKGRLTHSAKALNVKYDTLKKRIDADPELVQLVADLRNDYEQTMLDSAEDCLMLAMSRMETGMPNALKAAFYVLNNKGVKRGYSVKNSPNYPYSAMNQQIPFENKGGMDLPEETVVNESPS